MKSFLYALLAVMMLGSLTFAQTGGCQSELRAMKIRGLNLGMPIDTIRTLFPKSTPSSPNELGLQEITITANHATAQQMQSLKHIGIDLLDGKIIGIYLRYESSAPWTGEQFIVRVSEAYRLSTAWERIHPALHRISCGDLRLTAEVVDAQAPSLALQDLAAFRTASARLEEIEDRRRKALKP